MDKLQVLLLQTQVVGYTTPLYVVIDEPLSYYNVPSSL